MSRPPGRIINCKYTTSSIGVKVSLFPETFATPAMLLSFFVSYFLVLSPPPPFLHSSTSVSNESLFLLLPFQPLSFQLPLPLFRFFFTCGSTFSPSLLRCFLPFSRLAPPPFQFLLSSSHLNSHSLLPFLYPSGFISTLASFSFLISYPATTFLSPFSGNSALVSHLTLT